LLPWAGEPQPCGDEAVRATRTEFLKGIGLQGQARVEEPDSCAS
jgi:hypothetical protein